MVVFLRNYLNPGDLFVKLDRFSIFDDRIDFFTDEGNNLTGLIVIFVTYAQPETPATAHTKAITATGAGHAFAAGTLVVA